MSILFTMRRIDLDTYAEAIETGCVPRDYIAENERVGKGWGVLLYLLSEGRLASPPVGERLDETSVPTAAWAIVGGQTLSNEPDDYGGARVLAPASVKQVSEALDALPPDEVIQRLHTLNFKDVYGEGRPDEVMVGKFEECRSFYAAAAAHNDAMIVWLF